MNEVSVMKNISIGNGKINASEISLGCMRISRNRDIYLSI
jgi:predicted oxidoreductase